MTSAFLHEVTVHKVVMLGYYKKEIFKGGIIMEAGVRNKLTGTIEEIKSDGLMALVRMTVDG